MATRSQQSWITVIKTLVFVMIISWTASGVEGQANDYFSHTFNCSRYSFFYLTRSKTWQGSLDACKNDKGTLVCIETKDEWISINNKIKTSPYEWYIGLRKVDNHWKWMNGKPLQWTNKGEWPWHTNEPNFEKYAKIWNKKNVGNLFDDVNGNALKGYICEYTNAHSAQCEGNKPTQSTPSTVKTTKATTLLSTVKTNPSTSRPVETTRSTTLGSTVMSATPGVHAVQGTSTSTSQSTQGNSGASTQRITPIHIFSSTETPPHVTSLTAMSPNPTEKISDLIADKQVQKDEFPITYLATALAVLLLFLICMLVAIYCWKNKMKDKGRSEEDGIPTTDVSEIMKSNSFVAFKMVHNNIGDGKQPAAKLTNDSTPTDGTYAEIKRSTAVSTPPGQAVNINENSISSPSQDGKNVEVVYAAVDKSAKKKKVTQEPQVTYADLASFNNNEDTVVHMPPPYQPVQYAEIVGTKKSKGK